MNGFAAALFFLVASPMAQAVNPIEKVLQMMSDLQAKVIAEGEDAQKLYDEAAALCENRAQSLGFEIKTGKAQVHELKATIESKTASITEANTKIEDLSSDISSNEADLKGATAIREKEAADFAAEEGELKEVIDSLERAISILTKELSKGGASMLQIKTASNLAQALGALVQASAMSADDATKLTALVQEKSQESTDDSDSDDDAELGAPAAAVTESKSGGIIGTLEGLLDKAEEQLDKARKTESTAAQNYKMLKQSLTDETKFAKKDMDEAKTNLAESQEAKSVAEGALEATSKDLAGDTKSKEALHQECMATAQEFEAGVASRKEELTALATAKKVVQEATGGALVQTYDNEVSFVQVASRAKLQSKADLARFEAVRFVRELAKRHQSTALAQLASRMSSAVRLGSAGGADPFAKVKGLITDMLATLESEAEDEASHKAYCDKEMSETTAKKDDKSTEVESLTTKSDQKKALSAKLKEQAATLQNELAANAKQQAEASALRNEQNTLYKKNKAEMEMGLSGVKKALKVLREYYAKGDKDHESSDGAGAGIIGLLEVVESDFSKGLAEIVAEEESAASEYEAGTNAYEVETAAKEKDVAFKTKEFKGLDKAVSELGADTTGSQEQLDSILEYDKKIKESCVAKAEPYEERKKKREQELAGLKEALTMLEGESFLQRSSRRTLRGVKSH